MYKWSCSDCIFLDKSRCEFGKLKENKKYGCNARNGKNHIGYICGYVSKDSELKKLGCSYINRLKFGDNFALNEKYNVIYLGKVSNKRLLYNADLRIFKLVKDDWGNGKKIRVLCRYGHDKMCKDLRRKYIHEQNCNRNRPELY